MTTWPFLGLTFLVGNAAAWWLAIWVIFRWRLGPLTWVPVAIAAFGVPMIAADLATTCGRRGAEAGIVTAWAAIPLANDATRGIMRLLRRHSAGAGRSDV
jgi:hypothetical protein